MGGDLGMEEKEVGREREEESGGYRSEGEGSESE